ncbi:MAG: hypothetical protein LBS43_07445 [Prevotellaceae bacterium]|jgi:hypothetical protein|nr:hypothetical protein [Prevotellaceae bacterium]
MIVVFDIFQGEIEIGQLESPSVQATVQVFIDKYEPIFLHEQIGDELAAELAAGLSEDPVPEKWTLLADMLKYPAAEYVYCKYMRDRGVETAGIGTVETEAETAKRVSAWSPKIVRAWNEMVDCMQYLHCKLTNSVDYPDYCRKVRYRKINSFGI